MIMKLANLLGCIRPNEYAKQDKRYEAHIRRTEDARNGTPVRRGNGIVRRLVSFFRCEARASKSSLPNNHQGPAALAAARREVAENLKLQLSGDLKEVFKKAFEGAATSARGQAKAQQKIERHVEKAKSTEMTGFLKALQDTKEDSPQAVEKVYKQWIANDAEQQINIHWETRSGIENYLKERGIDVSEGQGSNYSLL